jgi:putative two-component system response regulator
MSQRNRMDLHNARVLIIDDQATNVRLLHRMLTVAGYHEIRGITEPREAFDAFVEFQPDLVLLDLQMPGMDGFAVMEQLQQTVAEDQFLPILVLTGEGGVGARERALGMGAKDFVDKPFHVTEVMLRIRNLLETRFLHLLLHDQKAALKRQVDDKTRELFASQTEALDRLAQAAEFRDVDTGQHAQRVGELSATLGLASGLPEERVTLLRRAAPLHDLGKIGIPDSILLKPGPLTPAEFEVMKAHTTIGARLLEGGATPLIQMAQTIALSHHEKWNGTGYPNALQGDAIPVEARIVAVADFFDALTHDRPYRSACALPQVREMMLAERERAFDPEIVERFLDGSARREQARP